MPGPPSPAPASLVYSRAARRSSRLGRPHDDDHQSPCPPDAAESPLHVASRRSVRIHTRTRIRGLPSAASSPRRRRRVAPTACARPLVELYAEEWRKKKEESGAPEEDCILTFLQKGAPRKVECLICSKSIMPDERMQCSVSHCKVCLHKVCSEKSDGCCPRHICFYCKKRTWRRVQHTLPVCTECSLQRNRMIDSGDLSKIMVCWSTWPSTCEDAGPADDVEEAFRRLPLPYTDQEFSMDPMKKEELENGTEPPPYVHLKRNVYLVKNKCDGDVIEGGCTDCVPALTCQIRCSCRSILISCSRACHCSDKCTNKPFRREKQIEIVKTERCGWGVIALKTIEKDDFVTEFVGEVIDDVTCEERLQDMKQRGDKNFYMCKVSKNFVLDATFKGNACRFMNHSCNPNCQLQKWQVNRKTRLGVFASRAIEVGEPLTYNYRFSQHFGPRIECFCGAGNCQGNL